jgi:hypothetical protein
MTMHTFAPKQKKPLPEGSSSCRTHVHETLSSFSKPLDQNAREQMESRFGRDFSRVRVHTDSSAGEAAESIRARAALGSPVTLQRQEDPRKKKQPLAEPGLGPAASERPNPEDEGWLAMFKGMGRSLVKALERADRALTLNTPQSWGLHLWGEGSSSEGSTAAKPARDVAYLSPTGVDLPEVLEMMDALGLAVSSKDEMFMTPGDFPEKTAEYILDRKQKLDKIDETREEERKGKQAKQGHGKAATVAEEPAKSRSAKSKPAFYQRDPMGYWNSYPLVSAFQNLSGDPYSAGGAVAAVTDHQGTRRVFRYWIDRSGYQRSQFLN